MTETCIINNKDKLAYKEEVFPLKEELDESKSTAITSKHDRYYEHGMISTAIGSKEKMFQLLTLVQPPINLYYRCWNLLKVGFSFESSVVVSTEHYFNQTAWISSIF